MSSEPRRRFPAPWSVVGAAEAFVVVDAHGTFLTFTYFDEVERGANSIRWMKPAAREIAEGIARLPAGDAMLPSMITAPCTAEDRTTWFKVTDANRRDVCAVYVDEPHAGSLSRDEARRIAAGIARTGR